jgi:hypothetical protein
MSLLTESLSPSVTSLIRMDHAQVIAAFHQFSAATPPRKKEALAGLACIALDIHAQLEEEVFYPALRDIAADTLVVEKSEPEHAEIRRLIARLRTLRGDDAEFDAVFAELMRDALHHIADEETTLLPAAERLLADRLGALGAQMTRKRVALMVARGAELAALSVRALPQSALLFGAGTLAAGATLFGRAGSFGRGFSAGRAAPPRSPS